MTTYLTPGVYFEQAQRQKGLSPQRTDIAGFVGIAERGPLHEPVRLTSWREYHRVFGGFLPYAHLSYAVRAFFENGGAVCQVVRVADAGAARSASAVIPDGDGGTAYDVAAVNTGSWGNGLVISLQSASLAATQHSVIASMGDDRLAVVSVAGFEKGSRVRLAQRGGPSTPVEFEVLGIDPVMRVLTLNENVAAEGFDLADQDNPISVESMEFTLLVFEGGQVVERFENLAPDAEHSRFAPSKVNDVSNLVTLERSTGNGMPALPLQALSLTGGVNGFRSLNIFDYIGTPQGDRYGLAALAEVDEVGILAMPDLVIRPAEIPPTARAPMGTIDECDLDSQKARVDVRGTVLNGETGEPLHGVEVEASDGIDIHTSDSNVQGDFLLTGLYPDNIELLLTLDGFEERTYRVVSEDPFTVEMTPVDLPVALSDVDVFYGQSEMVAQCRNLRDRFAIIDPPLGPSGEPMDISGVQSWRARFDTPYAAIYYPWLKVRDPLNPGAPEGRLTPPSGHVAGVYAATDLAKGVFRPPANRALEFVEDVSSQIDDGIQGVLNPLGINVIRAFPGRGIRVFGARTMSSDSAWRFVNVRRLMSMLGESLHDGLQWAVFEPNGTQMRFNVSMVITNMLDRLWRQGAFVGNSPDEAYQVRCDVVTTTTEDEAAGRIIAEVRVAPTVPYEFIIIRLGLTTDELQVSEV